MLLYMLVITVTLVGVNGVRCPALETLPRLPGLAAMPRLSGFCALLGIFDTPPLLSHRVRATQNADCHNFDYMLTDKLKPFSPILAFKTNNCHCFHCPLVSSLPIIVINVCLCKSMQKAEL